jgi:ferric-dicitrate binding protein FerR (iron transport regulator)
MFYYKNKWIMITNDTDKLLARYFAGEMNPQDEVRLDDWLNESEENERYFFELTSLYQRLPDMKESQFAVCRPLEKLRRHIDNEKSVKHESPAEVKFDTTRRSGKLIFWLSCVAALITGIVLLLNKENTYTTVTDKSSFIMANDTEVDLKKGEISFNRNQVNDTIYLKGSATFKMSPEKTGHKIIKAGNTYIKDIGTCFTVDADTHDSVFVSVAEGEVLFYTNNNLSINLRKRESGYYLSNLNRFFKIPAKGNFRFSATPLDDVIEQLSRYFDLSILLKNEDLGHLQIQVYFENEDLPTILKVISITHGLKISHSDNVYVIEN